MDIKKYMKIVPAVAVLLLTSACNQNLELVEDAQPRIIPYTVSAVSDIETRATLDSDNFYQFETGDKLYVWGENISGELTLQTGIDEHEATFSGNLTWTGGGEFPSDDWALNAVLVGPNDMLFGTPEDFFGVVYENDYKPDYTAGLASSYAEAVENFSYLRTESTYGAKSFNFYNSQRSAFVSFVITLEDGTAGATSLDVSILNSGGVISSGSVMTSDEEGVITASFIAPVLSATTLDGAKVVLTNNEKDREISFGGTATLWGNTVYNVKKTYTEYKITASGSVTFMGTPIPFTVTKDNIKRETTLGEIIGDKFSSITALSSSGDSVEFGELNTTDWKQTTVTVKGTGDASITVSGTAQVSSYSLDVTNQEVDLTVAKMTPPEP